MFVLTAKVSKTKIAAIITILIAIVVLIAVVAAGGGSNGNDTPPNADTNDARVTFLAQYGWQVNADPVETQKVTIPSTEESDVFQRYNDLQKSMGYDLSAYSGKTVTRYVYEILNYPDAQSPVYATLFVHKGQVIGGDVTNTAPDGAMHGFTSPT